MNSRPGQRPPERSYHLVESLCANPVPATMVGVGLVGLAWLALGAGQRRADRHHHAERATDVTTAEPAEHGAQSSFWPADLAWAGESANGYSPGLAYGEADLLRGLVRAQSDVERESIRSRLRHYWQSASRQVRRSAWTSQDRFQYWLAANPLLIGAAVAVLGAAVESALAGTSDAASHRDNGR